MTATLERDPWRDTDCEDCDWSLGVWDLEAAEQHEKENPGHTVPRPPE